MAITKEEVDAINTKMVSLFGKSYVISYRENNDYPDEYLTYVKLDPEKIEKLMYWHQFTIERTY